MVASTTQRERSERCASGSSSAAPTYRKNPAKTASNTPRTCARDRHHEAEQDAEDGRDRDDGDPSVCLADRGMAGQQQADDRDPVAEIMDDHDHRDDDAEPAADGEAGRQRETVEEAVDAHAARPDDADVAVCGITVIELGGRLVPDMHRRELLDDVEREEAERRRDHDLVERADQVNGLGDQVEEGRTDPDAGTDRDDDADPADGAKRDDPAEEGGQERSRGNQEGG